MHKLPIKPISVNSLYRGRRFATPELTQFKQDMSMLLPKMDEKFEEPIEISFIFGTSTKRSDLDNFLKSTIDSIAEKYGFNDAIVYRLIVEKKIVPKGGEYISFEIKRLNVAIT